MQQRRKSLEERCSVPLQAEAAEVCWRRAGALLHPSCPPAPGPVFRSFSLALSFRLQPVQPSLFQPVCVKCTQPGEESGPSLLLCRQGAASSPAPRPPIRSQPSLGASSPAQSFYRPVTAARAARLDAPLLRLTNPHSPLLAGASGCCGGRKLVQKRTAAQQQELNDPSQ